MESVLLEAAINCKQFCQLRFILKAMKSLVRARSVQILFYRG